MPEKASEPETDLLQRALVDARVLLYVHEMLSESENQKVRRRLAKRAEIIVRVRPSESGSSSR